MARTIRDEIRLYGALLGLGVDECDEMANGGSLNARVRCMRELRVRYRRENDVATAKRRAGEDQLAYWRGSTEVSRFIYFIQSAAQGPVKIGIANDPIKRMRDLQTGNPAVLHLRHVVPGDRDLEKELHHRFREARIRGEWFGLAYLRVILIYAEGLAAEHIDCFERERRVPQLVGGRRVVTPARVSEMRRELARLLERYDYWPDALSSDWGRHEVNEIMAADYGMRADEVEQLAHALRRPWAGIRGR